MNILITSAGAKVWLVEAFREALMESKIRGDVFACDANVNSASLYMADEYIVEPDFSNKINKYEWQYEQFLYHEFDAIVPTRNDELSDMAKLDFNQNGINCKIIVSNHDSVCACLNKDQFLTFCAANNFPVPAIMPARKLFYRPVEGSGGKGCGALDCIGKIYQEFCDWPEYTIDVFIHPDGTPISAVPRERIKVVNGESWISKTVRADDLMEESTRLCKSIGLVWHNTVQAFYNGKDIKFIEINPRFGGGAALGFAAGANTPKMIVDIIRGKKVKPIIGKYKVGLTMYKYTTECYI
jgi:carbamoyl-phosphate synthase large subunit